MGPGFVCSQGCTAAPLTGGLWFHCIDVQDLQGTVVASLAQCSGDWLVLGGTWPVFGGTGWFVVVIRGERILFFGPNTNTNNIRNQNFDRIRIRIIFVFSE